jgi:hypothetical protein
MLDMSVLSGEKPAKQSKKVIHIKKANKGKLHEKLGVKAGKKLTVAELDKAKDSSSPAERKEATFAKNARSWNK